MAGNQVRIHATVDDKASRPLTGIKGLMTQVKAGAKDSILTGVGMGAGIGAFNLMTSAVGAVTDAFALGISEVMEAEKQMAQTEARLRSTGSAANVTASEVASLAKKVQDLSGIDAEAVQEGQNLLLTFTRIRNEVGAGNDIFAQATHTMGNMSVAFGMDMTSAAMLLGKALNDPVKGVTALQKAGVLLTAEQKNQIKAFVAANDVMSAQKIILAELETEVGGAAEAFGNTTSGKLQKAGRAWEDFTAGIITGLVDVVSTADMLGQSAGSEVNQFAMHFGDMAADIDDVAQRTGRSVKEIRDAVIYEMHHADLGFEDAITSVVEQAGRLDGIPAVATEHMAAFQKAITETAQEVATTWDAKMQALPSSIRSQFAPIRGAAFQTQVEYAKGLADAQDLPRVQMEVLKQMQAEVLTRAAEETYLLGLLNSQGLADGLADNRPAVQEQAEATRLAIIAELDAINGGEHGYNIAWELAGGLNRGYGVVRDAAGNIASAIKGQIGIESEPKDPTSPLRGITKWGGNIAKELGKGMASGVAGVKGAAAGVGSAVPGAGMAMAGGGEIVIHSHLYFDGKQVAESIERHQRNAGGSGYLPRK